MSGSRNHYMKPGSNLPNFAVFHSLHYAYNHRNPLGKIPQ